MRYAMLIEGEAVGSVQVSLATKRDALKLGLPGEMWVGVLQAWKREEWYRCRKAEHKQRRCEGKGLLRCL